MDSGAELYQRFLSGDNDAMGEIVREYKDSLTFYLYGYTGSIHDAEDLTEDTFVKLVVKKPVYRRKSSFKTWIYAIGRNTALDYLRRRKTEPAALFDRFEDDDAALAFDRICMRDERRSIVRRAMSRLRVEHRQMIWLVYFEDFSAAQAAQVMNKSVHAAETLIYRARIALKQELEKEGITREDL